jgi:hypothetical protein
VGRHVEADGNLSLRLVADSGRSRARRQTERHAGANRVQTGGQRGRVAVGLAGRFAGGSSDSHGTSRKPSCSPAEREFIIDKHRKKRYTEARAPPPRGGSTEP